MRQHFLIVGQGLAGSLLAQTLIEYEQAVTIVDRDNPRAASRVAAGIINPLTGQRMVVGLEVEQCLPAALAYYDKLAHQFNQPFYFPKTMLRLYRNHGDKDRYRARCNNPVYQEYLGAEFSPGGGTPAIKDSYGGFEQKQTGYLDINRLLDCLREYFKQKSAYLDAVFDYAELDVGDDAIRWKGQQYDHVIFCEGSAAVNNPWFRWLPFQLSKGELITVESENVLPDKMVNRGYWILPVTDRQAKVGATYTWDWTDDSPTANAREELLEFFRDTVTDMKATTVFSHQCGVRPTTRDKQPFVGTHPRYSRVHCFNGFGSRGAMLIPFYANRIYHYLSGGVPLPESVDIHRFLDFHSLVVQARYLISEKIKPGDIVIDATVGNGFDTELLARCVGDKGHVFGFDVQEKALVNTHQRLSRECLQDRVTLIKDDHSLMNRNLDNKLHEQVSMVVFNLGFLPGSDKTCTTLAETTLLALQQAVYYTKIKGTIVVMTYSGHDCGKKETELVKHWFETLDKSCFECRSIDATDKIDAPLLLFITKIKNP